FFQAEDGIRYFHVTGVQTCALPIFMLDPDLLLLDEPLGALDPMIRADLQRDLKVIFTNLQKTVVLVTHDLAEAAYLGDEIVLLQIGRASCRERGKLSVEVGSMYVHR